MTIPPLARSASQIALAVCTAALGVSFVPAARAADAVVPKTDKVEHGRYLVNTSGCMDCHTPLKMGPNGPERDLSRLFSGHPEGLQMPPVPALPEGPWLVISSATNTAFAGPWGVSYAANLTPDVDTGLGAWTVRDFKDTIRTGRHMGRGRAVLPPMPIPVYNHFTDDDVEAVFAYLRTVPPVKNRVPEPQAPRPAATAAIR